MTKPVNPNSLTTTIIAVAKTEDEKKWVRYFKKVCWRDGMRMDKEVFRLISQDWVARHPKPGNPQKQLSQFDGSKKSKGLCEVEGCSRPAEYLCFSAYMFGADRRLCRMHAHNESRLGNLRGTKKLSAEE